MDAMDAVRPPLCGSVDHLISSRYASLDELRVTGGAHPTEAQQKAYRGLRREIRGLWVTKLHRAVHADGLVLIAPGNAAADWDCTPELARLGFRVSGVAEPVVGAPYDIYPNPRDGCLPVDPELYGTQLTLVPGVPDSLEGFREMAARLWGMDRLECVVASGVGCMPLAHWLERYHRVLLSYRAPSDLAPGERVCVRPFVPGIHGPRPMFFSTLSTP